MNPQNDKSHAINSLHSESYDGSKFIRLVDFLSLLFIVLRSAFFFCPRIVYSFEPIKYLSLY